MGQRHVERRPAGCDGGRLVGPGLDDGAEETVSVIVVGVTEYIDRGAEIVDDDLERGSLFRLVRRGDGCHGVRVDERIRRVQDFEGGGQPIEPLALGCSRPSPRGKTDPLADTAPQGEEVDLTGRSELDERRVEGIVEVGQVARSARPGEEVVRESPAAQEDLIGELAAQHQEVSDALRGRLLGKVVEAGDTDGREREEIRVIAAVHREGVPVGASGVGQHLDGIVYLDVPGEADGFGVRRWGFDHLSEQPARCRGGHARRTVSLPCRRGVPAVTDCRNVPSN